jgi:ankyrin repeat protein
MSFFDLYENIKRRFADCGESSEFHAAARAGDTRKMNNLAARDPSVVNKKDSFGRSALWIVASVQLEWTERTLNYLVRMQNIDLDSTDVRGQTPVFAAAKYNHTSSLEILLDAGADPNGSAESAESPLHVSVRDGMPEVASILLKYGASPDGERPGLEHRVNFGTIPVIFQVLFDLINSFLVIYSNCIRPVSNFHRAS